MELCEKYVRLATEWHDGQSSMLYAIASTGGLSRGTNRPRDENGDFMSDAEWALSLWSDLSCELGRILRLPNIENHEDFSDLCEFQYDVDRLVAEIEKKIFG